MLKSVTPLFFQPQTEGLWFDRPHIGGVCPFDIRNVFSFCFPKYLFKPLIHINPQFKISRVVHDLFRLVHSVCESTRSKGNNIKCQKKPV